MRRLHQHGVPGLQQGIKFLQHIGHGGRTAYAGGIHAGIASALGDERGQLSHADEAVQGKGGRMGPYATVARLGEVAQLSHIAEHGDTALSTLWAPVRVRAHRHRSTGASSASSS